MTTTITRARGSVRLLAGSVLAIAAVASQPALAATDTANLDVSATVTSNCVVSTTPLAFGDIDVTGGSPVDGSSTFRQGFGNSDQETIGLPQFLMDQDGGRRFAQENGAILEIDDGLDDIAHLHGEVAKPADSDCGELLQDLLDIGPVE